MIKDKSAFERIFAILKMVITTTLPVIKERQKKEGY